MAQKGVTILAVESNSLAEAAGLLPGDILLAINGEAVLDQLNYQFLMGQQDVTDLLIQRPDQSTFTIRVENGGDGIGLDLAADEVKVCKMNCVFCFVHQMPKGYRKSLYLKDEDIRLSFLYGHFTTLSSSDDAELDRIVREGLSPIQVSVHATDPEVRVRLVGNPREGNILRKIDHLLEGGVNIHTQVVLVPGLNDGWVWQKTVTELWERRAYQRKKLRSRKGGVLTLSCVPVGLTSHREGLPDIPDVDPAYAKGWIKDWAPQVRHYTKLNEGEPWLLLADEWFTRAGVEVPGRRFYSSSWAQHENGVGMVRRFLEHSRRFIKGRRAQAYRGRKVLILTGSSFAPILNRILAQLNREVGSQLRAVAVKNFAFGESVTVAGLLMGRDLEYAAHADRESRHSKRWVDAVVVPSSSLRTHTGPTDQYTLHNITIAKAEGTFLDDMTLLQLTENLEVPVVPGGMNLAQLLDHLEAIEGAYQPSLKGDLRTQFHKEGLNVPQGAYNP